MKVGDVVKYHFPTPVKKEKTAVLGIITFISDSVIKIDCADTTKLRITGRNFDKIELVSSVGSKGKELAA